MERAAKHLMRPVDAVKQKAHRMGLKRPRLGQGAGVGDLATAFMELQGLGPPGQMAPPEPVSPEELQAFADDPSALFAWLGVDLFPYQEDGLRLVLENDRTALVWGRQTGKDTLTALYGLHTALVTPGSIVVCVSPSQRQSDLWMAKLKAFALSRPEVRDAIVDLSQSELALSNGSRVYSLPSGVGGGITIRGFSKVSLLVFNEAAWVAEEVYQAAGPFLAASEGGKTILISTPFGQSGYLWRAWNSPLFAKSGVPSSASPLISDAFLEKERETMDALSYASEYEARFLSSQNAYFPTDLVRRCVQAYPLAESPLPEHEGMAFHLGCDWGRVEGGDRTVLTVVGLEEERGRVLWIKPFEGTDYVQQASYVEWLHGLWHFNRIHADASNHAVVDLLKAKDLPVDPVPFTAPSKAEMYGRLKAAMEAGRLVLPDHRDLIRELSTFEYRISERGNLLLHHAVGGHDDYPDSLALAARPLTRPRFEASSPAALRIPSPSVDRPPGARGLPDPQDHLAEIRRRRSRQRTCYKCGSEIEGAPGVDRTGHYHPPPAGCPEE
ncbi:MAG: hypothetical protein V3U52_05300 [Thermoplasmata archaeon]